VCVCVCVCVCKAIYDIMLLSRITRVFCLHTILHRTAKLSKVRKATMLSLQSTTWISQKPEDECHDTHVCPAMATMRQQYLQRHFRVRWICFNWSNNVMYKITNV